MCEKGDSNIVLIGMPGSGKTTVGEQLAKHYGLVFIDGDTLIEAAANMSIQSVINHWGLKRFNEIEQRVLCDLNVTNAVISTGGSAVYSEAAMHHLGRIGRRVHLKISRQSMLRRVTNTGSRGLYKLPAHSLMRLYAERASLYLKYADMTFDNDRPFSALRANALFACIEQSTAT